MEDYTLNTTTANHLKKNISGRKITKLKSAVRKAVKKNRDATPVRRQAYAWGIRGYRPDVSTIMNAIHNLATESFDGRNSVRDEARWLALYCADEEINLQFLMEKTGLRRSALPAFCAHYSVDLRRRTLIGGIK